MARRLTDKQWLEIKTRYELGDSNNSIARDFDMPESTIRAKAKAQNWTRELRTQVSEVQAKISEIASNCEPSQLPIVQERLNSAIQLMQSMNEFINIAARINVQTISELEQQDLPTRVMGLNKLKATMPELANMVGIQKEIATNDSEDENSLVTVKLVD